MQENEFEKQVKQKMDEFRLRPSEPVWLEIRKKLQRKRRRRMLLFLPLAALLLAGGYLTWQSVFPEKQLHPATNEIAAKNKNDNKTKQSVDNDNKTKGSLKKTEDKSDIIDPVANKKDKTTNEKSNEDLSRSKEITPVKTKATGSDKFKESKSAGLAAADAAGIKIKYKDQNNPSSQARKKKSVNKITEDDFAETGDAAVSNIDKGKINKPLSIDNNGNGQLRNETGSFESNIIPGERNLIDNTPVSLAAGIQRQIASDSIFGNRLPGVQLPAIDNKDFRTQGALKIGLNLAIGASSRTNKPLQLLSSSSAEKNLASALGAVGGVNQGSFAGGVLILPPSDVKPGVAFKAGITVSKSLSKRFDISSGLLYSYSSDHIQVGKSLNYSLSYSLNYNLDVRNQSSYTNANVQGINYTNKYHFIELPVSVSYNLTRKWRAPLTWNAGVSLSRLISTNALLYDAAWGGVYYDGKSDINKTQFNISTGFSLRFNGHNGWQWNIGPQLYISGSKLFNSAYDENKHPLYGGLHLQVLLPSRKRSK